MQSKKQIAAAQGVLGRGGVYVGAELVKAALEAALSAAEPQPAPPVAVKALEALLSAVKASVRETDEPHRVILKDGTAVTGEIADLWLNFMHLIREVCEQALSAQVQDVACETCNDTGKEARHQICRDCDDGWQFVPKEPTEEMVVAWQHGFSEATDHDWKPTEDCPSTCWSYMLAAAPAKQEG